MQAPVGIIGASGYSGVEATRLLARHPGVTLRFVTSDRWLDQPVSAHLPELAGPAAALRYVSNEQGEEAARDCAVVLLATPAEGALERVPRLLQGKVRVIDFSGAFRLKDAALYPAYYGFTHPVPQLLEEAVYGLPELGRERIGPARLVANPGCYATAVALAFAPLLQRALLAPGPLIADAASGVTGAGRKASEDYSFAEVADDFRAYRTLKHQHTPEIRQTLAAAETRHPPRPLTFTPHLLPLRRGILVTGYARLCDGVASSAVAAAVNDFAGKEGFVRASEGPDRVSLRQVVGTNQALIGAAVDGGDSDPGRVVLACALDNLLKGAAGQAIQNLNLMLGLDEGCGLDALRPSWP